MPSCNVIRQAIEPSCHLAIMRSCDAAIMPGELKGPPLSSPAPAHSHALTENGRTTHSHVPTGGKSTLTFTLSHRRERKHTPHHSHKGWRKHSLTLSLSHTEGIARSLSFSHIEGNGHTLSFSHTSAKAHSLSLSLRQHGKAHALLHKDIHSLCHRM